MFFCVCESILFVIKFIFFVIYIFVYYFKYKKMYFVEKNSKCIVIKFEVGFWKVILVSFSFKFWK